MSEIVVLLLMFDYPNAARFVAALWSLRFAYRLMRWYLTERDEAQDAQSSTK